MPDSKHYKSYQTFYEDEQGKVHEGLEIKASSKREANDIADGVYGETASCKPVKRHKILGII